MATNTADSSTEHTGNGSTTSFSISFTYLSTAEIDVKVNNVVKSIGSDYTISGQTLTFSSAPSDGHVISIKRDTNIGQKKVDFEDGSVLTETDLDNNTNQLLFGIQEIADDYVKRDGSQTITGNIVFEGSVDDANETTLSVTNPTADRTITVPDVTGTIVTTGDTGTVTSTMINDGTIVNADINNSANIAGTKLADDSVTLAKLGSGALPTDITVASANIVDGTIVNGDIANNTITGAKLVNDTVTLDKLGSGALPTDITVASANIVDGTIVEADIANSAVTQNKLANNSVGTPELIDGAVTTDKLGSTSVTTAKIANTNVTTEKLANNAVTTNKINNSAVTAAKIADDAVTLNKIGDNQVRNNHIFTQSVGTSELAVGAVTTGRIADDAVTGAKLQDNAVTFSKIATGAIITNSEQAASTPNDTTFFTTAAAEARYFNASTGETIKDGQSFPDNDTTIATTAAINDRIIDLVDDVGGFVPIANETSFPTANPDVNNGTGTIVSVATASTNLTPSGTTVTIANGAGSGNTVTITGVPSVISSGFGFLVETTTTLHTYTFHRLVPKATEVTTVAGKAVEIGRLGTADAVADMAILGTTDVVADMNLLATSDVVADMALLATTDVIADMALLAVTDVISDMNDLATSGNITAMSTCSTNIASINNASSNISSVNNFGDKYQVASSDPSTDGGGNALAAGDLYFNTSANELKVYTGSAWQGGVTATGNFATVTGNTFTGDNIYNDNVKAKFGTGSDLQIHHDGINTFIDNTTGIFLIRNNDAEIRIRPKGPIGGTNEESAKFKPNAAVELYFDNSKKLETTSTGATVTGSIVVTDDIKLPDNGALRFGGDASSLGDLRIYHDGSNSYIKEAGTGDFFLTHGNDKGIASVTNGGVKLYYDNSKKFETLSGGVEVTGHLGVNSGGIYINDDNQKLHFGAGQDLQIFHDSSDSRINNSTGFLTISNSADLISIDASNRIDISDNFIRLRSRDGSDVYMTGTVNSSVDLYFDGTKKFETTSVGVNVIGNLVADCNSGVIDPDSYTNHFATGAIQDGSGWGVNGITFGAGTGHMAAMGSNNANLYMAYGDGSNANSLTTYQTVTPAGAVELYYNGSKKIETSSSGASVTGNLAVSSALTVSGGLVNANGGLQIENTDPRINLIDTNGNPDYHIRNNGGALIIRNITNGVNNFVINGAGEITTGSNLYVGNNLNLLGDNQKVLIGAGGDLQIYHDGTHSYLSNGTGNLFVEIPEGKKFQVQHDSEAILNGYPDGRVELYYDNNKKFETVTGGANVTGNLGINTTSPASLIDARAASGASITARNTGTVASIAIAVGSSTNQLVSRGANTSTARDMIFMQGNTTTTRLDSNGHFRPETNNTYDLGTSSVRWRNVYTNDLNLSNEGGSNDVDGTWGSYTIQEGAEDLFLINKRSGKKYKFALTEVS